MAKDWKEKVDTDSDAACSETSMQTADLAHEDTSGVMHKHMLEKVFRSEVGKGKYPATKWVFSVISHQETLLGSSVNFT